MSTSKNYRFETLQLHVGQEQACSTTQSMLPIVSDFAMLVISTVD